MPPVRSHVYITGYAIGVGLSVKHGGDSLILKVIPTFEKRTLRQFWKRSFSAFRK